MHTRVHTDVKRPSKILNKKDDILYNEKLHWQNVLTILTAIMDTADCGDTIEWKITTLVQEDHYNDYDKAIDHILHWSVVTSTISYEKKYIVLQTNTRELLHNYRIELNCQQYYRNEIYQIELFTIDKQQQH